MFSPIRVNGFNGDMLFMETGTHFEPLLFVDEIQLKRQQMLTYGNKCGNISDKKVQQRNDRGK